MKPGGVLMSVMLIIVLFLIGFVGAFISGMVGIGGSIIKYPMLLYIPALLGLVTYSPHEVAGISAIQVFFAAISGVWAYRASNLLNKQLIIYMGTAILIGSFMGGFSSNVMSENTINIVYAILATLAAIMMFLPKKKGLDSILNDQLEFNKTLASILSFIIGITSGIVGAAGGFIMVPVMLVILKIPTRITVASSLAITFISSIGSTVGKIVTAQVLYGPSIIMIIASVLGAPLGVKLGTKTNTKVLQVILSILILSTAIKIWFDIF